MKGDLIDDRSDGTTASEKYLTSLGRNAFLFLWSYPNLYRDQGKAGIGIGKELCDLLVVFGQNVLIFSDKHCALNLAKGPEIGWKRWYRDAVIRSAGQVKGAERWLVHHPERVYLDESCSRSLPISLPKDPIIHRILTCRGAARTVREYLGGSGSLLVGNGPLEGPLPPFQLGAVGSAGEFFHVFDEVALDSVLKTLDTVSDFCEYLHKRERFFQRFDGVLAAGEEELLGQYLLSEYQDDQGHDFPTPADATHVILDEGFWSSWQSSKQRDAKVRADLPSYAWDRLIEKFTYHYLNGTSIYHAGAESADLEPALRWMAREGRVRRRGLANSLLEILPTVQPGKMRKRYIVPGTPGDPYWVYLVLPRPSDLDEDRYRQFRLGLLRAHCLVVKHLHPSAEDICGIAVNPIRQELSEDIAYLDTREWPEALAQEAAMFHEKLGLFAHATQLKVTNWEYPIDDEPTTS